MLRVEILFKKTCVIILHKTELNHDLHNCYHNTLILIILGLLSLDHKFVSKTNSFG